MDTLSAMALSAAAAARNERQRVFDWNRAAKILAERKPAEASAGLQQDMGWTGGVVWSDGKPHYDDYTYLWSNWATPILVIDDEEIECWCYVDERGWNADTKWPDSALEVLAAVEVEGLCK